LHTNNSEIMKNIGYLVLFAGLLVLLQTGSNMLLIAWTAIVLFIYFKVEKSGKLFIMTNIVFGFGFIIYLFAKDYAVPGVETAEMDIFLDRFSLVFILIPLFIYSLYIKGPFITYLKSPELNEIIIFPFIWSGFHRVRIKVFLVIALLTNIAVMLPFMIMYGWNAIMEVLWFAIIFSFTNAILEELIWRGVLLSRFTEQLGEKWAVMITSLGFGLQHYSLGFPWPVCIGFAFGGFFYAVVTIKSNSILPAIIWHIVLNFLMVFSGLIGN
jgi:uncharacterized protein